MVTKLRYCGFGNQAGWRT